MAHGLLRGIHGLQYMCMYVCACNQSAALWDDGSLLRHDQKGSMYICFFVEHPHPKHETSHARGFLPDSLSYEC